MLDETKNVEVIGSTTEPLQALKLIPNLSFDVLFLDIQMPELNGFELLQKLDRYPPVIFTTAFDEFALKAFEVNSIDYLLKPVESERLDMAIAKLLSAGDYDESRIEQLLTDLAKKQKPVPIDRLASRTGGRVRVIETAALTHFFSQDKITIASDVKGREHPLDDSLNALETKLDPAKFIRVHRGTIVNLDYIDEVHGWFSGRVLVRLKDIGKTEVVVARDRVKVLKSLLGM